MVKITWAFGLTEITPGQVPKLTFTKPLVGVQHQVLFGCFQLLHQPLVLGSDLSDSLLPMLQDFQLGIEAHDLLPTEEGGVGEGEKQKAIHLL